MPEVIRWALLAGALIFALGLTSAIGSRMQSKASSKSAAAEASSDKIYKYVTVVQTKEPVIPKAMSMAESGGQLNGEENLASVGNNAR